MGRFRGVRSPLIRGNERKRDIWDCEALCVSLREAVFSKLCRFTVTIRHMATIRPFLEKCQVVYLRFCILEFRLGRESAIHRRKPA